MPEIILHQYDTSPFSEKVRICLGIKGLSWRAVDQPVIMPKPDLVPLTGGYRRIPVLQIGADIYCDSQLIVRELDRRFPEKPLFPAGSAGMANAVEQYCEKAVFQTAVLAIFGTLGDAVDPAFIKDREALSGQPFNVAAMKALAPFAVTQMKAHAALLAEQFTDGRAFFAGADPCLADAAAYYNFWFVRSFAPGLADRFDDLPGFDAWYDRVTAIGHGTRSAMTAAEALAVATAAQPEVASTLATDAALVGNPVSLAATDYGRDPITGAFVGSTQFSLTVARDVPELGAVNVHVPRLGYSITPA
jgi:glutathione S-transferase